MGGERAVTWEFAAEVAVNLVQQTLLVGFLYLYFDTPAGRAKRAVPFALTTLLLSAAATFFSVYEMAFHYVYYIAAVLILVLYAVVFLRGRLYLRIIIPIAVSNILIAYLSVNVICTFGSLPFSSTPFRYAVLYTANLFYGAFLYIVYRFGRGEILMRRHSDMLAFLVIPLTTYAAGFAALLAFETAGFRAELQIYIVVITLSVGVTTVTFWYLLIKAGRDSRMETELLMTRQREELYRESVLSANEQIERISAVKHDTKNILMTAGMLIAQGEYDKARTLCERETERLNEARTPLHTDNPTLNAIVNVELDKAAAHGIDCACEIGDSLTFMEDDDLVSVIGNLCDNAIEYLAGLPAERRSMSLEVTVYRDYCRLICRNAIAGSVLGGNPNLRTAKPDAACHGKGVGILKRIAADYHGDVVFTEENQTLTAAVVVGRKRNHS